MTESARRINALAGPLGAKRYLEIGVSGGATFRDVNVQQRTGVDPAFAFDINEIRDDFTRLVSQTSDEFFSTEPMFPSYDLIFIDGLHTFEQVTRDFTNALMRSHRRSVFLIDDTLPNDVFSAERTAERAFEHRKASGDENTSWHGDVFKFVFFIHDFWPSLNFRTYYGSGNPQTLVWRGNDVSRVPILNDMERISRLTYFDLQENLKVLALAPEEEVTSLCIRQVLLL